MDSCFFPQLDHKVFEEWTLHLAFLCLLLTYLSKAWVQDFLSDIKAIVNCVPTPLCYAYI